MSGSQGPSLWERMFGAPAAPAPGGMGPPAPETYGWLNQPGTLFGPADPSASPYGAPTQADKLQMALSGFAQGMAPHMGYSTTPTPFAQMLAGGAGGLTQGMAQGRQQTAQAQRLMNQDKMQQAQIEQLAFDRQLGLATLQDRMAGTQLQRDKYNSEQASNLQTTQMLASIARGGNGASPASDGGASDPETFLGRLAQRESGGQPPNVVNAQGYQGVYQFGDERLKDLGVLQPDGSFKVGDKTVTRQEWMQSPELQKQTAIRHVSDIDRSVAATPGAEKFSLDGLRAVAHLGGIEGMRKFVATNGQYNPADANGTSLQAYYQRFGGGGAPAPQQPPRVQQVSAQGQPPQAQPAVATGPMPGQPGAVPAVPVGVPIQQPRPAPVGQNTAAIQGQPAPGGAGGFQRVIDGESFDNPLGITPKQAQRLAVLPASERRAEILRLARENEEAARKAQADAAKATEGKASPLAISPEEAQRMGLNAPSGIIMAANGNGATVLPAVPDKVGNAIFDMGVDQVKKDVDHAQNLQNGLSGVNAMISVLDSARAQGLDLSNTFIGKNEPWMTSLDTITGGLTTRMFGGKDVLSHAQAFNALRNQVIPAMRVAGSGSTSDKDMALFTSSTANLANTEEGNRIILGTAKQAADYAARVAEAKQAYLVENKSLVGWNDRLKQLPGMYPDAPSDRDAFVAWYQDPANKGTVFRRNGALGVVR